MERILDVDDPRLVDYRHLNDAEARAAAGRDGEDGCTIVEGAVALRVVAAHEVPLRSVLVTPSRADSLSDVLRGLRGVPVLVADREVLAGIVGFDLHRGVLASASRPRPLDVADVLARSRRIVVTEGLNDHENLGALFRNAAALDLDAVAMDDRTTDPLYRRSVRVSSGWAAVLPHVRIGPLPDAYASLRAAGLRVVALTPAADALDVDRAATEGVLDDRVALVVGAEGPGLSAAAVDSADARVRVPMAPGVDSLNVATSLAVVGAFAAARRRWR